MQLPPPGNFPQLTAAAAYSGHVCTRLRKDVPKAALCSMQERDGQGIAKGDLRRKRLEQAGGRW